jgi:integrase/recombinase XerD
MTPLRRRMIEDMEIRNLSPNTQLAYLQQVSSFAKYCQRSPEVVGPEEIRAYQVHVTDERKLAPGSLSIIASALRFLYRVTLKRAWVDVEIPLPKKPFILPVILSREEVAHFFESIASCKHRTILMTAYAAGLRVSEVTRLKLIDIDSQRMMIRVDQGKGRKCFMKHLRPCTNPLTRESLRCPSRARRRSRPLHPACR